MKFKVEVEKLGRGIFGVVEIENEFPRNTFNVHLKIYNSFNTILGIDGLVNNAGICVLALFEWNNVEKERQVFEVNYWGPVRLVRALLPLLKQSRGRIINVSSISGNRLYAAG